MSGVERAPFVQNNFPKDLRRAIPVSRNFAPHFASLNNKKKRCDMTQPRDAGAPSDILYGADQISEFLFGDAKLRRRVYNLVQAGRLPVFRMGTSICARRSVLLRWIATEEDRHVPR